MTAQPVLEVRRVTKHFGAVKALTEVDFRLERGEIHALCGENGAGKSTLMNIIAGVLQPNDGEVLVDGAPVKIASPAIAQTLGIGLVHQEIALCPDATVAENMFMAATNRRRSPLMNYGALEREAQVVMNRLAPIDVRRKVADLGISSQQLVEIAKALSKEVKLLILDEPTAALDAQTGQQVTELLKKLSTERGHTVVVVTHDNRIFHYADRTVHIEDGLLVPPPENH